MALISPEELVNHPEYIQFLLSPDTPLDFHVNVGNVTGPDIEKLEQIKVVKWMLIARSKVLRVMLLESEMRPKKSFDISDINHNTFKNFLVFVYGHDNTTDLPFEDAVDLLSVAEKYDVADLKRKLGVVVKSQVSADNVLTILQYGPVCETVPDLWAKATDVIQTETQVVFGHPKFLTLRPEAVVHILQQEALSVEEIDVWRASLAWARHQLTGVGTEPTPQDLRRTLEPLLIHTRLCTVPLLDFSEEVAPTMILKSEELQEIMISIGRQVKSDSLPLVCNEIKGRTSLVKTIEISTTLNVKKCNSTMFISTNSGPNIILVALTILTNSRVRRTGVIHFDGSTYNCSGTVSICKVTDKSNNTSSEIPVDIPFDLLAPFDSYFKVPLEGKHGRPPVLQANTIYFVKVAFRSFAHMSFSYKVKSYEDFSLSLTQHGSHIGKLHYIKISNH